MALKDIIVATQADLRANADHAVATFSADSRQIEGLRSEAKIRQFSLTVDEPPSLGGNAGNCHLNRAMDNGLTQAQAAEVITHLAFYVGWPNAFSALPVAKDVFEKRPH